MADSVRNARRSFNRKLEFSTQARTRSGWLFAGLAFPLLAILVYAATNNLGPSALPTTASATEVPDVTAPASPSPLSTSKLLGDKVDLTIRRNDTLEKMFRRLRLSLHDLTAILSLPGVRQNLARITPGEKITVMHDGGAVHALHHRISETEVLSITRSDRGFAAEVLTTPIEIKTARASGTIDSSLFTAARAAGVSPETILQLANDIFGWEIDFALDIRQGDRFNLIYEQKYRDGQYVGDARILAAEFVNEGEIHRAVRYISADGKIDSYFAPDGHSMRRQFLRAPLDFTRVSSNFNPARRHPIMNTIRAHQGVDYAAPTGTIIKAAGDGRVAFVGVKGSYGRVITLEHGGGISTLYGHMSRFAQGVHHGQRVKQGDTIGYVGTSGAATGPHLHYEYRVNGVHLNPRTVKLPDAAPIPAEYVADFRSQVRALVADLEQTPRTVATSN